MRRHITAATVQTNPLVKRANVEGLAWLVQVGTEMNSDSGPRAQPRSGGRLVKSCLVSAEHARENQTAGGLCEGCPAGRCAVEKHIVPDRPSAGQPTPHVDRPGLSAGRVGGSRHGSMHRSEKRPPLIGCRRGLPCVPWPRTFRRLHVVLAPDLHDPDLVVGEQRGRPGRRRVRRRTTAMVAGGVVRGLHASPGTDPHAGP